MIPVQKGMCFTVEPGLYFPLHGDDIGALIKPEFRGIGMRIEDDILIDPLSSKVVNLTQQCPVH